MQYRRISSRLRIAVLGSNFRPDSPAERRDTGGVDDDVAGSSQSYSRRRLATGALFAVMKVIEMRGR